MPLKEENKKRSAQGSYVGPWAQIICPVRGCRFERKKKKREETRAWSQQKRRSPLRRKVGKEGLEGWPETQGKLEDTDDAAAANSASRRSW